MEYRINANAKINMGLNILEKLPSGYHTLDMIMAPISLSDRLSIKISEKAGVLRITTNKKEIPTDHRNILHKIYKFFYTESKLEEKEILVHLKKIIPHEAGLGGGSSDGAMFLKILNKFHNNYFSDKQLESISLKVGADIPFFIQNYPSRVNGIGEKIQKLENNIREKILLIKPNFGISTKKAYESIGLEKKRKTANIDEIIDGMREGNIKKIENSIVNQLEESLLDFEENLVSFRERLNSIGYKFFMSGSGSAYFAFVSEHTKDEHLKPLQNKLNDCEVFLCNFL
ncbi:4-(cytidine 5'-diphospho)-2-C-methyl-D-erythritol kinase [Fusobacterium sp. PH5-44]|uniref:4-(cytidine 5'-diphospho)-2-C-methyl-D-erythritol kinase n=1 Tax=unclassified Fusobacterium TaxID=2648384 RepID=UPI003D1A8640